MKKIIVILLMLNTFISTGQTYNYTISSKGSYIGNLKITKAVSGKTLKIEAVSEVTVNLYVDIDFKYELECTYEDNVLLEGSVITYVNGKVHSTTKVVKDGGHYNLTSNGKTSKYDGEINFSSALLYFKEPTGLSYLFSEFDNMEKPITDMGGGKYQVKDPRTGHLSEYEYANGVLLSATNHHTFLTFKLTKK